MKSQNKNKSSKNSNGRPGNGRQGNGNGAASAAAAYASGFKSMEPRISGGPKSTRIAHRELVDTITGTTGFGVFWSYILNPGIGDTFEWLSTQAKMWEQYRFHKLCFHYITRCATTAVGSVILSPDYDSMDAAPEVENQATNNRDAVEDAPWKDFSCVLDVSAMHPLGPRKYVRTALAVPSGDYKTYDAGQLHLCTNAQANTDAIGKLWVEYDVEFFVPQTIGTQAPALRNFSRFNSQAAQTFATTVAEVIDFEEEVNNGLNLTNTAGSFTATIDGNYHVWGDIVVNDSSAEAFTASVEVLESGVAMNPAVVRAMGPITVGANGKLLLSFDAVSAREIGQALSVRLTLTGAAGTLTIPADGANINFELLQ